MNGFDYEKHKIVENELGIGKAEDREFKTIRYADGYYEGEVLKGTEIRHGRGLWIGECLYEGYWRNDKRHGKGLFIFDDGNYTLGDFRDGKPYGEQIESINGKI